MAIYPRIKDVERNKIPEEHRCEISYNGYHSFEIVRETPSSTPCMVCTKCQNIKDIDFPKTTDLDK
jgi:hypothetical protein